MLMVNKGKIVIVGTSNVGSGKSVRLALDSCKSFDS